MSLNDIQNRLKDDPETVYIDVAGKEKPFLLSTLGMERARERKDPLPILLSLIQRYSAVISKLQGEANLTDETVQKEIEGRIEGSDLNDLSLVLWSGFLTFDEDVSLEEIQIVMSPGRIFRSGMQIARSFTSFVQDIDSDEIPDAEEIGGEDSGN